MRTAEIIAVGSELLTPDKIDTNSLWLTDRLSEYGIEVMLKTVVGDDEARLEEAIRDALKRSDVVITTGGMGPTEDDMTRTVAAKALDTELVFHEEIVDEIRERFRSFGREMPETNKRQAFVIKGADVLPNPNGTAVGMMLKSGSRYVIVLPGPPRELQPMFDDFVLPNLSDDQEVLLTRRRILKVIGMGESAVDEAISDIYKNVSGLQTSLLFNKSEVEVRLAARSAKEEDALLKLDEVTAAISEKLGNAVFSTAGESLEEVVGKLLIEREMSISTAESCTGGLIARRLTEIAGASAYFMEGAVTYSNEAKIKTLNVSPATIEQFGAVSIETAEAMAAGMRERSGTDIAVSITGIAGPGGGSEEKPVGLVCIGYADRSATSSRKFNLPGDRYLVRWRSSSAALDLVRRMLLKNIG